MFFLATVMAGLLANTASSAYAQSRHYSGYGYAPSCGSGERSNPTNTNGF